MKKKLLAILLALVMVAAVTIPALATSAAKFGNSQWAAQYLKADAKKPTDYIGVKDNVVKAAADITPNLWDRGNASGDKIPSNAHSGDYVGLFFYWNDKQKDNGYLFVLDFVFDYFKDDYTHKSGHVFAPGENGFVLTAKNSNDYWGYKISRDTGVIVGQIDGVDVYAYSIPKQLQYLDKKGKTQKEDLKNINMVFIDGEYKDAYLTIEKEWFDEEGNPITDAALIDQLNDLLTFNYGLKLGYNVIKITAFDEAANGKKLAVTEGAIAGYKAKVNPINVTVKWDDAPTKVIKFENQKQWAKIEIVKIWLEECGCGDADCDCGCVMFDDLDSCYFILDADDLDLEAAFEIGGNPADLGYNEVKSGTYTVEEVDIPDGFTLLYQTADVVTVEPDEVATVIFYNLLDAGTPADDPHIIVYKDWIGDISDFTTADLNALVSFTDGTITYTINQGEDVVAGATTITESIIGSVAGYSIDFVDVDISASNSKTGDPVTVLVTTSGASISFIAEEDVIYEITFTNEVIKDTPPPPGFKAIGKITSESHSADWWADYGIICLAGSTISHHGTNGKYFVALTDKAFDELGSPIYIGYGTQGSMPYVLEFTKTTVTLYDFSSNPYGDPLTIPGLAIANPGSVYVLSNPNGINGNVNVDVQFLFDNLWGSGSMQAYLLELE